MSRTVPETGLRLRRHAPVAWVDRHWTATALLALSVLWVGLWRLPVLMGDDRFFALASGLPRGRQTWAGVTGIVRRCLMELNGRLVDGLGAALFALGDTGIRLSMAVMCVALVVLLWRWAQVLREATGGARLRLDGPDADPRARLQAVLLAALPFLLIGLDRQLAGESIYLMAATWNYVLPLDACLAALLPCARRLLGRPGPWWTEIAGALLLVPALVLHEFTMIAVVTSVVVLAAYAWARRPWLSLFWLVPLLCGVVLKLWTPGLWRRSATYGDWQAGGQLEQKVLAMATSTSSWVGRELWLLLLLGLLVFLAARGTAALRRVRLCLAAAGGAALLVLLLSPVLTARRQSALLIMRPQGRLTLLLAVLLVLAVCVFGVALTLACWWVGSRGGSAWRLAWVNAVVLLGLAAVAATPHYAAVMRSYYLGTVFLGIAVLALLAELLRRDDEALRLPGGALLGPASLATVVLLVAGAGLVSSGSRLAVNRAAWRSVEAQVASAQAGRSAQVLLPRALPCADVTWYYNNGDALLARQIRNYYGLSRRVKVETSVVADLTCPVP